MRCPRDDVRRGEEVVQRVSELVWSSLVVGERLDAPRRVAESKHGYTIDRVAGEALERRYHDGHLVAAPRHPPDGFAQPRHHWIVVKPRIRGPDDADLEGASVGGRSLGTHLRSMGGEVRARAFRRLGR